MKSIGKFFSAALSWFVRITMMPLMLLGFRPKFHYEDKNIQGRRIKGAAVIISNHTSIFDPPMIYTVFPWAGVRMIAGELLYDRAILRWLLRQCRAIKIDRSKVDMRCMREVQETLSKGTPVGLFPEGTTVGKEKDDLLPFHAGTTLFALRAGVPVIPVFTSGEYNILFGKRLHIIIGKPIILEDTSMTPDNLQRQTDMLYEKMQELQCALQNEMNKK